MELNSTYTKRGGIWERWNTYFGGENDPLHFKILSFDQFHDLD